MPLQWSTPVEDLRGVGPARKRELEAAGLATVGDLLLHLPRGYQDRRFLTRIADLPRDGGETDERSEEDATREVTLRGRLSGLRAIRTRRRGLTLVRGRLDDDTGTLPVVWFNRPYLVRQVPEGAEVLLHGRLRAGKGGGTELLNPDLERLEDEPGDEETAEEAENNPRAALVPIYPAAGSCSPAFLAGLIGQALDGFDPRRQLSDPLPPELLERHRLLPLGEALHRLHRPSEQSQADEEGEANEQGEGEAERFLRRESGAHRRLIYGELLELQLRVARARARQAEIRQGFRIKVDDRIREVCRDLLPFRLTGAQRQAVREIVGDMTRPRPMLRLLQGDVGSGKTVVAALALAVALENGLQGAFMAPTELLAEQHYRSLDRLFGDRYRLGLLTGSVEDRERLRTELADGSLQLAVGTHALFQEDVRFHRLGLAVIDEQHRFGVGQRQRLSEKGAETGRGVPDALVMTATPIPRSLALTAYGDLDLSVIDEMPPGRRPVATEIVPARQRGRVYGRLAEELERDPEARAFVVFPLIEESDQVSAAAVETLGEEVRRRLSEVPAAVVHGRLPREEREQAMRAFARGEVRLLIATTVIEVGVDVPEATAMVIESAERFGLAQLHQLRGRVGRSDRPSRCIAIHGRLSEDGRRRLEVFGRTTDGFEIAEADLEIRGPGELLGTRQAGLPAFRLADLVRDHHWLLAARDDAREVFPRLAEPGFAALRRRLERRAPRGEGWKL